MRRTEMKKQGKLYKFITNALVLSMGTFLQACFDNSDDDSGSTGSKIHGTLTYNGETDSAFYIILDDDTDESNGYIKREIINPTGNVSSVTYEIDTSNVPSGSYYLLSGYDSYSPSNMDPEDSSVWEGKAWYGGSTSYPVNPPSTANINDLDSEYNITLIALP
jgi:hypothetical protein